MDVINNASIGVALCVLVNVAHLWQHSLFSPALNIIRTIGLANNKLLKYSKYKYLLKIYIYI